MPLEVVGNGDVERLIEIGEPFGPLGHDRGGENDEGCKQKQASHREMR